jgi:hypothetical protein
LPFVTGSKYSLYKEWETKWVIELSC